MPFPALPHLDTERLLLRAVERTDLPALLVVNGSEEATRYLPYDTWRSQADADAWYERVCKRHENGECMQYVVVDKCSDQVIGSCLLFNLDQASARAEIGYVLGRAHWGSGYMREATAALIDYAFDELSLRRLEAIADPRNLASDRLLRNLGFTCEGTMRQRWVMKGEIQDGSFYGLLRHEWTGCELPAKANH